MTHPSLAAAGDHAPIPTLDGFRALAIGIVLCSHIGLQRIVPGQFGVTLFFFLSGYLITTLLRRDLERAGRIDLRRFYLRRALRIVPPMYLTIGFVFVLSQSGLIRSLNLAGLPFDFLFLTNYFPVSGVPIGLWSLAVEEHFYLGFPLMLAWLARRFSLARCAAVCLGLCGVILAVRLWEVARLSDFSQVGVWTHTRIDSILYGAILALWNNPVADERNVVPNRWVGYAIAIALLLPTFLLRDETFRQSLRYTLQGLGLMALFNTAIRDRALAGRILDNRATRLVALLSYTVYLVHSAMIQMVLPADGSYPVGRIVFALALSFGFALLMHRLVERPLNRRRRTIEAGWKTRAGPHLDAGGDGGRAGPMLAEIPAQQPR